MTVRRTHVEPTVLDAVIDGRLQLQPDAFHRFARVLRLEDGARVELFDGTGRTASGELQGEMLVNVVVTAGTDGLPPLIVAQAVVKTDKLELVIQKGTELGASMFCLVDCARGQVHLGDRADKRRERLARIAEDASRQAGRVTVPVVEGPVTVDALASRIRAFGGVSVLGVVGAPAPLSEVLASRSVALASGLLIVVGPEGGLSPQEVQALEAAGALPVRLGAHVLRTETAAMVALAAAQAALGHL